MTAYENGVVYSADELIPGEWRELAARGPVRTFNPALLADREGWIFAYRLVAEDGIRRIGLCRLDRSLRVVPTSHRPLSDEFKFAPAAVLPEVARSWFADPRLYRFGARLFVYWNSGWHEPRNFQFLHELDPHTLLPIGHARELVLATGERQKLEKNWTLFADDAGEVFAVYSVVPHRILKVALVGGGDISCSDHATTNWSLRNYPPCHGSLRGGTPPQRCEGHFVSFCHSVHDGPAGYRYRASAYRFATASPFTPSAAPRTLLELCNPWGAQRVNPALNPAVGDVVYPCGAAWDGERWLISHGINDEHCAISFLTEAAVTNALEPVERSAAP